MAPPPAPVLLIEFNELTPRLMHSFMGAGQLPHFKRLYDESQVYVTDAEEEGEALNPWVQWVTVHTGLRASEHGIRWLSDGAKLRTKAVWDLLSDAGLRVWVCGSMNVRYERPLNGYLLPDPWTSGTAPYPDGEFDAYSKFIRHSVQEHTDHNAAASKWDAFRFLTYMATHGLSFHTVRATLKQLWTERIGRKTHWRRAALLDRFQFDVFRSYYRRLRPHFSTFFLNSTAHFQHAYWRNMEPEAFLIKPGPDDQRGLEDAIPYGYRNMDDLLGRLTALAGPDATIIFCTGLSQQPYLKLESAGGKHFYRLRTPDVLSARLRVAEKYAYHPVMAEQFCLRFESAAEARAARTTLARYRLGDEPVLECLLQDRDLMVKCNLTQAVPADATMTAGDRATEVPFFDLFYQVECIKSGYHHPDGMLWIRSPGRQHRVHDEKVPLQAVAPTILDLFDVPRPAFMTCGPLPAASESRLVGAGAA